MTQEERNELKEKITDALKTIYDPEIPVDIYELGLIYEVNIVFGNYSDLLYILNSTVFGG
jgi:metal-sulfur cluster biosynthetic enzyme